MTIPARGYAPETGYAGNLAVKAQDLAERAKREMAEPASPKLPARSRRTGSTIEHAVDLAMAQPNETIRVRRTWTVCRYAPNELPYGLTPANEVSVYHYGTRVLTVNVKHATAELGPGAWGSVSDQGGVNRVLRHLGIPLMASRRNGFTLEPVR